MSARGDRAAVAGVGVAACAACCAGPILGVLAAIGLTTAAATFVFGAVALLVAGVVMLVLLQRRRAKNRNCGSGAQPVEVQLRRSSAVAKT